MKPFVWTYAMPVKQVSIAVPYTYDRALQLNVLADGRAAIQDTDLLRALGSTTSTAGSATHFDD
jgi:putative ATP-grasp target RiPP